MFLVCRHCLTEYSLMTTLQFQYKKKVCREDKLEKQELNEKKSVPMNLQFFGIDYQ